MSCDRHPLTQPGNLPAGDQRIGVRVPVVVQQREHGSNGPLGQLPEISSSSGPKPLGGPRGLHGKIQFVQVGHHPINRPCGSGRLVSLVALAINPDHPEPKLPARLALTPDNCIFNWQRPVGLNSKFFGSFTENCSGAGLPSSCILAESNANQTLGIKQRTDRPAFPRIGLQLRLKAPTAVSNPWERHIGESSPTGVFVLIYPFGFNQLQKDLVFAVCPGRRRSPYTEGSSECPGAG